MKTNTTGIQNTCTQTAALNPQPRPRSCRSSVRSRITTFASYISSPDKVLRDSCFSLLITLQLVFFFYVLDCCYTESESGLRCFFKKKKKSHFFSPEIVIFLIMTQSFLFIWFIGYRLLNNRRQSSPHFVRIEQ